MQHPALIAIQIAVTIRMHLGRNMKTSLLNTVQQAVSEHLEIESQVAIELGVGGPQLGFQILKLLMGSLQWGHWLADQAVWLMAATSAAKSDFSTSMPSPRVKRVKRRTWMFSPTLPATCFTISATVTALSLMKG